MTEQFQIENDLWRVWRAATNVIEADEAGLYPKPLAHDTRKALGSIVAELSFMTAAESARGRGGAA